MITWYILATISALFSASAAILEKKILFHDNVIGFTCLLGIFNLILSIPFFFLIDFSTLTIIGLEVLFLKSILGAFAFICVMYGIKNLELSSSLPLLVLTPGLVAVVALITLGETLLLIEIIGIIFLLLGTYILQLKKNQKILDPWKNLFKTKSYYYIIIALLLFTITSILDKAILKNFKVPINAFMGFQHLFLAIIFLLILFSFQKTHEIKYSTKKSWLIILVLAIFTIIYRYTQIQAVKIAPVALVLSIKRLSIFFAIIVGGNLFKEHNLLRKSIATILMVAGAILIITS